MLIENVGSTARDFCMLERNILSHFKLGLVLSLLSSSLILHARLPDPSSDGEQKPDQNPAASRALATIQMIAALAAIGAGVLQYWTGNRDLRNMRAFLLSTKPHIFVLTVVIAVVTSTCIILLAEDNA